MTLITELLAGFVMMYFLDIRSMRDQELKARGLNVPTASTRGDTESGFISSVFSKLVSSFSRRPEHV